MVRQNHYGHAAVKKAVRETQETFFIVFSLNRLFTDVLNRDGNLSGYFAAEAL